MGDHPSIQYVSNYASIDIYTSGGVDDIPYKSNSKSTTVDGSEIRQTHQLRLVVYPNIYKVLVPS